jgi:hypothetical protein
MRPIPAALRALVERGDRELKSLVSSRAKISWRISKLSRALRELAGCLEPVSGKTPRLSLPQHSEDPDFDRDHAGGNQPARPEPAASRDVRMQRACRIALMEAFGPASLQELYERIQRRESCDFVGCSDPLAWLRSALAVLEAEGEVQMTRSNGRLYWKRMAGPVGLVERIGSPAEAADPGPLQPRPKPTSSPTPSPTSSLARTPGSDDSRSRNSSMLSDLRDIS